jgi:hypothetical protein
VGSDKRVKLQLSQVFTRGARPDSNSRPTMQISSPLLSRYAFWKLLYVQSLTHTGTRVCRSAEMGDITSKGETLFFVMNDLSFPFRCYNIFVLPFLKAWLGRLESKWTINPFLKSEATRVWCLCPTKRGNQWDMDRLSQQHKQIQLVQAIVPQKQD